jgi:transcription-repair coupling factor (superfamily II helicase)
MFRDEKNSEQIVNALQNYDRNRIQLKGLIGSSRALVSASVFNEISGIHLFILPDKETAAHFFNDIENIYDERSLDYSKKKILFYPTSYKRQYDIENPDNVNLLLRAEILNRIGSSARKTMIVTYPEALCEKVISKKYLAKNTMKINVGESLSIDFIIDLMNEYNFERTDFVVEPGQFSVRGGIVDVFSFSNDYPLRIEFFGDDVESIRTFDTITQLSIDKHKWATIVPDVQNRKIKETRQSLLNYIPKNSSIWIDDINFTVDKINDEYKKIENISSGLDNEIEHFTIDELFEDGRQFLKKLLDFSVIEFGRQFYFEDSFILNYDIIPQPSFNKNFELIIKNLTENSAKNIRNIIFSDNPKQIERLYSIFEDIRNNNGLKLKIDFTTINTSLHEGFIDRNLKIACYTDHQIFERHHRFFLKDGYKTKQAVTLKEIYDLKPGDFVTHIDHGIGKFDGLEKIENNGKQQEAIRLVYKNNDLLYVSIHSLHRIAKYVGKEGKAPSLNKLGSNVWNKLKTRTKQRVKDIAKDLIKLYAERKLSESFQFSPDTYLQHELEASFIFEDTPDQLKATIDVKKDMEQNYPMDRLICGDVGFGKTEIAIRAAFKVVAESKQVALLVPTTILALQHYKTFMDRLNEFPCNINYINRFKSVKQQKQILKDLESGKIDVLIGTHRLVSKDIKFKDLGLLIIDEEQKFGVSVKEKLKRFKINVDTLILTATPIPRTLQFSLMGARDLSIINTPPPNRYPVQTEITMFNEEVIRDGIMYEISRGGQVFFVHNRIQNILEVQGMLQRFCPDVKIAVAHGQLEGAKLEKIMLDFIEGKYDVLVATTIIESGLDIPNVNTIFINDAQNYGLSDLHQLRGRVGRTNKKALCYLLSPPLSVLTTEARKRLKAIEEFAELGSGFNIAMRDLDIRGAGNILGGEQSGFISEIGFEMYHKILDEAIMELKENEFKDVFKDEKHDEFVKDCLIETDLEILIPDHYITNITERLSLYKELDNIQSEEVLLQFRKRLIDRFGPVPKQTAELLNAIRLRWLAKKIGFEKIVLKNKKLTGYFISKQDSPYYQSEKFTQVLRFVQQNPSLCRMREAKDKLTLTFFNVETVEDALELCQMPA